MNTIKVTFPGYPVVSSYLLEPTKRKGFYEIKHPYWIGIVSKNSVKCKYYYEIEYTETGVERLLNKIREAAFHNIV